MNTKSFTAKTLRVLHHLSVLDFYPIIRPLLFRMDPEKAHALAVRALHAGLVPHAHHKPDPVLATTVSSLAFPNPVGLAAGFDKQAEVMSETLHLDFGFTEVGTITPEPQPGNPVPRLFRILEAEAAINRFGFNSDGAEVCARRIAAWRDVKPVNRSKILGVNIGKNKDQTDAAADYVRGVEAFAPLADYLAVNVSSPNTPGLRDLQGREEMARLLTAVLEARNRSVKKPPIFIKVAPDQTEQQEQDIADVCLLTKVDGLIIGNTTTTRPSEIPPHLASEAGGLSGKPLRLMSTALIARMYRKLGGKVPIIGCGGISSGEDAYDKIKAGASLVQIYTALIFEGPRLVPRVTRDLANLLRRDGFTKVSEAVGTDHR